MDYRAAAALLRSKDQVLILTHHRPDGDTIGCAGALSLGLRLLGKTSYVLPNPEAHGLYSPYIERLLPPDDFTPSFVVAVDMASEEMLPDNAKRFTGSIDLCIDHHGSNTGYAKETCLSPGHAACGELLYLILKELGTLDSEIALLLYVAISTDTGCYMFSNTTAETHRITAELFEIGFDYAAANKRHFRTKSLARLKLEGMLVAGMTLLDEGRTVFSLLTLEMIASVSANEEDLENIAAFIEQVQGAENAAIIRELRPGEYKISLRTGANLHASRVCAHLGGGGHPAAAGATVLGTQEEARAALIRAIAAVRAEDAKR